MTESSDASDLTPPPPIAWSGGAAPYAYVAQRALVRGEEAAEHLDRPSSGTPGGT